MAATRTLCRYVVDTNFGDLPSEVIEQAKVCILNILGVELGGYRTRIGQLHVDMAKHIGGGRPESTIVGDGTKVSAPLAAYANGNLGFALDYEDMIHYILHAGYISVAASLAVGELVKASGRDFLTGIVLAYEVGSRIALAMQPTPERGSKVWGEQYTPFCAVVPAGKLLRLDEVQMDAAFGVAGTYATVPSAYKYFGIVKDTRPMREVKLGWGWQCMAGVFGAISAKEGFTGGHGILDGDEGFWIMEGSDRCDFETMTEALGTKYYIMEAQFKKHPSIGWIHPPHAATKELVEKYDIRPEDVEHVLVKGMGTTRLDDNSPAGAVDAMFSLPYGVATTILRERLVPGMYSEEKIKSPEVQNLLSRIRCEQDPEADRVWFENQWLVYSVEITLKDGRTVSRRVEWPRDEPFFGKKEVEAKFRELASEVLPAGQVENILETVYALDSVDDIARLTALLH